MPSLPRRQQADFMIRNTISRTKLQVIALLWGLLFSQGSSALLAEESLWLEAEHFRGIQGYCWPMGPEAIRKTNGNWGLSGPGWAAEWNQGGESGFLSIATGVGDASAKVSRQCEIPASGNYFVWVRYGDWREQTERFNITIDQPGSPSWTGTFGAAPVVEEDNEMKLYWGWAFGWGSAQVPLQAGPTTISLVSSFAEPVCRQIDVVVLTTDANYSPLIKDRPANPHWDVLENYRANGMDDLEPLTRGRPVDPPPDSWKMKTFRDKGFLYLWNVTETGEGADWLTDSNDRVLYPHNVRDPDVLKAFRQKYGGKSDVPIFSDPRIVPTFHGVGPGIFHTDPTTGELTEAGQAFCRWLDRNPDRAWGMMMNYHNGLPIGPQGIAAFQKYRDRYVGSISGESLGYFYPDPSEMRNATEPATNRRQLVETFTPLSLKLNADKYRAVFGGDFLERPYEDVISCLSVGNIAFAPLCSKWGARTIGYESSAATSSLLSMRWAFLRGIARQGGHLTATYRSCNFGDSATIFSNIGSFHTPQNILDNYYSVFSGAGMTWYKMDIWYQYMAGASMFYHEQGFDEYWLPGGTTAAGQHELQLSPKGKLVDRFLRQTAAQPDRGIPFTPVAILVDYAHGWEPAPFWPNSFKNWHEHQDRFLFGEHERALEEFFWTAFYPMGKKSQEPISGTNEVFVPGMFGDIFDVITSDNDISRWKTIDAYPVVMVAGDIELTLPEGQRLRQYVERGGTLFVSQGQLTGPGAEALGIPKMGDEGSANSYQWLETTEQLPSQWFRFRPIVAEDCRVLARETSGLPIACSQDIGQGRLVFLSIPRGLGINRSATPLLARLIAHGTRNLMPVEVKGDVEWLVNRLPNGWLITLLNPAGQDKPQQGITPTDYRENRLVTIRSAATLSQASDRLQPSESLTVESNGSGGSIVTLTVPAGGVRIVEFK